MTLNPHMHERARTHTHPHEPTHTHTHTHTYTHIRTHTHTHCHACTQRFIVKELTIFLPYFNFTPETLDTIKKDVILIHNERKSRDSTVNPSDWLTEDDILDSIRRQTTRKLKWLDP